MNVGRLLAGVACGAASLYVPRYLSEIAPVAIRGGISTLNQARHDRCALDVSVCLLLKRCPASCALSRCAADALMRALLTLTYGCQQWVRAPGPPCQRCHRIISLQHHARGLCMQVFICVGILVAYIVGLPYDANQPFAVSLFGRCVAWWRIIFGLGIVPALLQACSPFTAAPQPFSAATDTPQLPLQQVLAGARA